MKERALELAKKLEWYSNYPEFVEAGEMLRRLVEELDCAESYIKQYQLQTKPFNEEEFNAIAYSYRSWPAHDPKGVSDRYQELLNYLERHGIK